jgi:predicted CxxxxCH...CXXCH cytochrome family protein
MRAIHGALVVGLAASACSEARSQQGTLANPVSWEEEIAPLFTAQCNSCHSGANAQAGYRTTSYLEALGPTSAPVAKAGDPSSLLLRTIDPANTAHPPVAAAFEQTQAWVVPGRLSFFRSGIHEGGILNPNDPQFHSNLVRERGWNFSDCQSCHGTDFIGGKSGVSCQECHALQVGSDGVPSCTSCHGGSQSPAPPRDLTGNTSSSSLGVGAHQAHVLGKNLISAPITCDTCHLVPTAVDSTGHLDHLRPAVVTFSGLAVTDGAAPAWDRNAASCSSVYCHGGGAKLSGDTKAGQQKPVWTGGTAQAFCGGCHGVPPSIGPHGGVVFPNCSGCHPRTVDASGNIIVTGSGSARTSFHINGVIDVGP